jgi:putative acetyltransferase
MIVRDYHPADGDAVEDILLAAFPTRAEADLVEQLRSDGDALIELVACDPEAVVGHILFSPLQGPLRALALAPVAVAPGQQGCGIGTTLIEVGHERAREDGWDAVFVVGDPAFYSRFGYSLGAAEPFASRYAGPHFMLLPLTDPLPATSGELRYAAAFAALDA